MLLGLGVCKFLVETLLPEFIYGTLGKDTKSTNTVVTEDQWLRILWHLCDRSAKDML